MEKKQLQLVNFEQAKRLKEVGFDFVCDYYYCNANRNVNGDLELMSESEFMTKSNFNAKQYCRYHNNYDDCIPKFSAPSVALALKWCRDKKCITYEIEVCRVGRYTCRYVNAQGEFVNANGGTVYNNYEAAESALLDELLNLTEKEK